MSTYGSGTYGSGQFGGGGDGGTISDAPTGGIVLGGSVSGASTSATRSAIVTWAELETPSPVGTTTTDTPTGGLVLGGDVIEFLSTPVYPHLGPDPPTLMFEIDFTTQIGRNQYAPVVTADNPVGYWRFANSGTSQTAVEGPTLTIAGTATRQVTGPITGDPADSAVDFQGGFASASLFGELDGTQFTLEIWVYPTAYANVAVFDVEGASLGIDAAGRWSHATGRGVWTLTTGPPLNAWTYAALVSSPSSDIFYVDGAQVATRTGTQDPDIFGIPFTYLLKIPNGSGSTSAWRGRIDEPAFYNHALTDGRIGLHHASRLNAPPGTNDWSLIPPGTYRRFEWRHGRNNPDSLEQPQGGTLASDIDNTSRELEPEYTGSPHYPNVRPGRPARLRAQLGTTTYNLFRGHVDDFAQSYAVRRGYASVPCYDLFERLVAAKLPATYFPQELSGRRIGRLLDAAGWPTSLRAIDDGQETIHAETMEAASLLRAIQDVANSEFGIFFVDGAGNAVLHDRRHRETAARSITSQGTFGNGPGEFPYLNPTLSYGQESIKNEIRMIRPPSGPIQYGPGPPGAGNPVEQVAIDYASYQEFGPRTFSRTVKLTTDAAVKAQAQRVLAVYLNPRFVITSITIDPRRDETGALWRHVLERAVSDRITVIRRPSGAAPVVRDYYIEAINSRIQLGRQLVASATWVLSLAA